MQYLTLPSHIIYLTIIFIIKHKPRGNAEERAPSPIHHVLQRTSILHHDQNESIFNYQFLDDEKYIKIYISLENIGILSDQNIMIDIKENSVYLSVKGLKEGKILILNIKELYGDIVPLDSSWKKKEHKLILSLAKKADENGNFITWRQLKK